MTEGYKQKEYGQAVKLLLSDIGFARIMGRFS